MAAGGRWPGVPGRGLGPHRGPGGAGLGPGGGDQAIQVLILILLSSPPVLLLLLPHPHPHPTTPQCEQGHHGEVLEDGGGQAGHQQDRGEPPRPHVLPCTCHLVYGTCTITCHLARWATRRISTVWRPHLAARTVWWSLVARTGGGFFHLAPGHHLVTVTWPSPGSCHLAITWILSLGYHLDHVTWPSPGSCNLTPVT